MSWSRSNAPPVSLIPSHALPRQPAPRTTQWCEERAQERLRQRRGERLLGECGGDSAAQRSTSSTMAASSRAGHVLQRPHCTTSGRAPQSARIGSETSITCKLLFASHHTLCPCKCAAFMAEANMALMLAESGSVHASLCVCNGTAPCRAVVSVCPSASVSPWSLVHKHKQSEILVQSLQIDR